MPQPYAFRGAFALVNVYSPTVNQSHRFDLGVSADQSEQTPYATDVTVKVGLSMAPEIQVVLQPPSYDEFLALLLSPFLALGNTLSVRWGYTDDPAHVSDWHHSFMQKPEVNIDESFQVSLIGKGFSFGMKRSASQKVWSTEKQPRSLLDVVKEIAGIYKMEVVVNDGKDLPSDVKKALENPRDDLVQSGINDWAWCRREVTKLGLWFWIDHGFRVHIWKGNDPPKPKTVFVMNGPANPAYGVFPMWNYSASTGALFLPGRGVAFTQFGPSADRTKKVPELTKSQYEKGANAEKGVKAHSRGVASSQASEQAVVRSQDDEPSFHPNVDAAPDANVKPLVDRTGKSTANQFIPVLSTDEFAQVYAQAHSDVNVAALGVTVSFESIDDPTLQPRDCIRTENLGQLFSGNHRVKTIEHKIGMSFGTMHVEAAQLGWRGSDEIPDMTSPAGKPKVEDPESQNGDSKESDTTAGA